MAQGKAYTYDQKVEIIERIADRLMDGESLRRICESADMPPKTTVLRWLSDSSNQELVTTIARARGLQSDAKFDQMDDILADVRDGTLDPNAAKVILWALQWQLAKLQPKKYGEKVVQQHSGVDGQPIQVITATTDPDTAARIYKEMIER